MSLKEPDLIKRVGVCVMSCDKTVDVARHFSRGLEKYWADIDFPIFLALMVLSLILSLLNLNLFQ